jgi:hypothetical protein
MKPRLLMRALCVGAALLVPAGGLAMLGTGTAGAATVKAQISGQIKLGAVGTILVGTPAKVLCTIPIPTTTKQCSLAGQWPIKKAGTSTKIKSLLTATLLVTVSSAALITAGTVKKGGNSLIKTTTGLVGNTCKILTLPKIVFTVASTGKKLTIATKALTGVTVTSSGSACTSAAITTITNDITTSKLSGTISVATL